ncbi:hypothetical protein RHSIM_Rhsim11G0104900 [Rhododendron simsii]|uniref:Uncharacterized protein n=1 Tax=Rhododendron simsii TaxID=118357 RepID=A0A834L912_RHOSS|nr:hypothetical protein RHSIM_Rhsim11G0104900 [Rhododendron simsii]
MGGNNGRQQQNKKGTTFISSAPSAVFNMFKPAKRPGSSRRVEDSSWDGDSMKYYKVWPSDEDRGRYVAEPGIDRKASAYIAKIRAKTTDHSTAET